MVIFLLCLPCILCVVMICRRKAYPPVTQAQTYDLLDQHGLSSARFLNGGPSGGDSGDSGGNPGTINPVLQRSGGLGYQTLPLGSAHSPEPYAQARGLGGEGESPASMEMAKMSSSSYTVVDADLTSTSDTYESTRTNRQQRLRNGLN